MSSFAEVTRTDAVKTTAVLLGESPRLPAWRAESASQPARSGLTRAAAEEEVANEMPIARSH